MQVIIRLIDTTEICNKHRKRIKPHDGKVLTITHGCKFVDSGEGGPHSRSIRHLVGVLDGTDYLATDGSQEYSVWDVRKGLKTIFSSRTTGLFTGPLMIHLGDAASSCHLYEIVRYEE